MPRKSVASFEVVAVDGKPDRLSPPPHLNKAERNLFSEIVGAVDAQHFVEGDLPLLCSYVTATLIARKASHDVSMINVWEKAARMQATLATRLRLSPQSRLDPKTVARRLPERSGPAPWER